MGNVNKDKEMVCNKDLQVIYGFSYHEAKTLIARTKIKLVKEGCSFFDNKRLGKVPHAWIRKDLGLDKK